MPSIEQIPFAPPEFVNNPEPRCPCLLLLDTSGSMRGRPIAELNNGLLTFHRELLSDPMAMQRVEVAVMTFGPVTLVNDFRTPDQFTPPHLSAGGDTPMGAAILEGLDLIETRKAAYRQGGVA